MPAWLIISLVVVGLGLIATGIIFFIRYKNNVERSFDMIFLDIRVPKKESKEDREVESESYSANKDFKEIACASMKQFYESLYSIYTGRWQRYFKAQEFLSFEYAVIDEMVHFYIVCPRSLLEMVERLLTAYYPDAFVEEVDDYNIFKPNSQVVSTYMVANQKFWCPFRTYELMQADPLNPIVNSLSKVGKDSGAAIQFMLRPMQNGWQKKGRKEAKKIFSNKKVSEFRWYKPLTWIVSFFRILIQGTEENNGDQSNERTTPLTDEEVKTIEQKNSQLGFETIIRVVSAAPNKRLATINLNAVVSSFTQFSFSRGSTFDYTKWHSNRTLVTNYIFRNFRRGGLEWAFGNKMILSAEELASMFHLPNIRFNKSANIAWQNYKIAPPPANIPKDGLLLGHNIYRGEKVPIYMKREDRFRHFYVIGQTGTGKSSILQVKIRQDLENGDGLCIIDPHGSLIESILPFIPRHRADDVIYFNPGDMERPLGLNLLEGGSWEEIELVALDAMNIMIKLFDEEVFGPRIQDYFRNGCLTLMSDPQGGALTDIVRLFTDDAYAKTKRVHIQNPVVKSFWDNQMAKTGAREKQEMIPYFAAKFGQFVTNTMMRNIIGQTKSAFDFSKVMQEGKILLMNLSKGTVGEINSKLLGLIIVQKIQMAALRREKLDAKDRRDFFLYIDEFQNYVTDSIESILSEARKYRLGLTIAHQYLGQLEDGGGGRKKGVNLKDAVFGNVGSMMCYKIGAQDAEHMAKEMAPVFSDQDLINMDKYKGVMKLSIDTQPSRPFSIIPVNPYTEEGDKDAAEAFKQLSRLKYGKDRDFVEKEILLRIGA